MLYSIVVEVNVQELSYVLNLVFYFVPVCYSQYSCIIRIDDGQGLEVEVGSFLVAYLEDCSLPVSGCILSFCEVKYEDKDLKTQ